MRWRWSSRTARPNKHVCTLRSRQHCVRGFVPGRRVYPEGQVAPGSYRNASGKRLTTIVGTSSSSVSTKAAKPSGPKVGSDIAPGGRVPR